MKKEEGAKEAAASPPLPSHTDPMSRRHSERSEESLKRQSDHLKYTHLYRYFFFLKKNCIFASVKVLFLIPFCYEKFM